MTFEELKIYSIQVIDALEHKKDRELGKHNEKEKKKQEELLINQIAFNVLSIKSQMALFNNECAFGKSYVASIGAVKYIAYSKRPYFDGVLFVCEFKKDCEDNAKRINDWYKDYAGIKEEVAIDIDPSSMSRKEIKGYLETYSFVFITHSKYRRLLLNSAERYKFIRGRGLLIIDEYIDFVQPVEFSSTYNVLLRKDVKELGGKKAVRIYDKITYELNYEIARLNKLRDMARDEKNKELKPKQFEFFNAKTDIKDIRKLIGQVRTEIEKHSSQGKLMEYQKNNDWTSIFDRLKQLENFYLGTSVEEYSSNEHTNKIEQLILVPSYYLQPYFLKNNILLDASAELNTIYKYLSHIYHLVPQKKIFDHSSFTIKHLHINGTKSAQRKKYINYEEASRKIVKELRNEQNEEFEKTLVVTIKDRCVNKDDEQVYVYQIPDEEPFVAYYEILKSNNGFKDFQNSFLETLYMPPPRLCILKYLYFTRKKLQTGDIDTTFGNDDGVGKFRNVELEEIRKYEIANLSYQAIKRINRDMLLDNCKIVWNCHYDEVVNIVRKMMLNCNYETDSKLEQYYVEIEKEIDKDSYLGKTITLCNDILDDKIPTELQGKAKIENNIITFQKKDIYEYLGFTKTPFSRIIKDKRFIKYAIDSRQICYIISKDEQVIVDDIECNNRQMKFIFKS